MYTGFNCSLAIRHLFRGRVSPRHWPIRHGSTCFTSWPSLSETQAHSPWIVLLHIGPESRRDSATKLRRRGPKTLLDDVELVATAGCPDTENSAQKLFDVGMTEFLGILHFNPSQPVLPFL